MSFLKASLLFLPLCLCALWGETPEQADARAAVPVFSWDGQWPAPAQSGLLRVGKPAPAEGAEGGLMRFDGKTDAVSVAPSAGLDALGGAFTVALWVRPDAAALRQQALLSKNDYAAKRRQWSLMLDEDGMFRFYVRGAKGWLKAPAKTPARAQQWQHVAVVFYGGAARLYVDGEPQGSQPSVLGPVPAAPAPLTLGASKNGDAFTQFFAGAMCEVRVFGAALSPEAVKALAAKSPAPGTPAPQEAQEAQARIWSGASFPATAELADVPGVEFYTIQPWVGTEGFQHGVALAWHKGKLYATFAYNAGAENTAGERAIGRVSEDGGKTWGEAFVIAEGGRGEAVSHGVLLSHAGRLWSFNGAFSNKLERTHTRAYTLDEASGKWTPRPVEIGEGFWPLQAPRKMDDGNWIMGGLRVAKGYDFKGNYPAVAISRGDDFTRWDMVVISPPGGLERVWGESAVFVNGPEVVNISRWGKEARALVAHSADYGRSWTQALPSNLPMGTSKPEAGRLSTGQAYLVCTNTADSGRERFPLTIALGASGEQTLSNVFVIRHAVFPEGPGESAPKARLSYPYAVEHDGNLYVAYSNNGGRGKNQNSIEMAVIPLASLAGFETPPR